MASRRSRASGGKLSAFKRLQDQLCGVDLVFEVRDARLPAASGHPEAARLFGRKPRLIVLAKADLADPHLLAPWMQAFACQGACLALALKSGRGQAKLISMALELTEATRQAKLRKGLRGGPIRACVVGMPNVGKSSLINWLTGRRKTRVGNRPGITRGTQWVILDDQLQLLDTPGIIPNVALSPPVLDKLALLNLVPETMYDLENIACSGIELIENRYPGLIKEYYGIGRQDNVTIDQIARQRRCLAQGGSPDGLRAAALFLSDLQAGKLGRLTLESPPAVLV